MVFEIYWGNEVVGTANVERQGLYYRFSCRCRLGNSGMYRLSVSCNDHHENLGVLVPMGDVFGVDTKLAVKRLGEGRFHFLVLPKHTPIQRQFIPIYPEEPFSYISRLQNAFLEVRNGQIGVVI